MARGKQKAKKSTTKKAAPRRRAKSGPSRTARAATSASDSAKATGTSGVERHWREYWKCRTKLEQAVEAVRAGEKNLATARELERACREEFDRNKENLKRLLEVEPAAGGTREAPLLDFGAPEPPEREIEARGK